MRKVFVPVAIAAGAVAIVWKVRQDTNARSAHHDTRCPPLTARVHGPLAPARVSGQVTKKTGGVIAGATVALMQSGLGADLGGSSPTLFATTDASGAWAIEDVRPGDYVASRSP